MDSEDRRIYRSKTSSIKISTLIIQRYARYVSGIEAF